MYLPVAVSAPSARATTSRSRFIDGRGEKALPRSETWRGRATFASASRITAAIAVAKIDNARVIAITIRAKPSAGSSRAVPLAVTIGAGLVQRLVGCVTIARGGFPLRVPQVSSLHERVSVGTPASPRRRLIEGHDLGSGARIQLSGSALREPTSAVSRRREAFSSRRDEAYVAMRHVVRRFSS